METVIDHQKLSVEILFKFFKIMAISSLMANSWKQFNSLVFVVPSPPHHLNNIVEPIHPEHNNA